MTNPCDHVITVLVRLACGAGGTQYPHYCRNCWCAVGGALPHKVAREMIERTGIETPLADLEVMQGAQHQVFRRSHGIR